MDNTELVGDIHIDGIRHFGEEDDPRCLDVDAYYFSVGLYEYIDPAKLKILKQNQRKLIQIKVNWKADGF